MERRQEIRRTIYAMIAVDGAAILVFVLALLSRPRDLPLLATICFVTLFLFNFVFLRRKLRNVGPPATEESVTHSRSVSVYACSVIFFVGTLYGVLMIAGGELPRTILPLLLVPLSLAVYLLKVARRAVTRRVGGRPF